MATMYLPWTSPKALSASARALLGRQSSAGWTGRNTAAVVAALQATTQSTRLFSSSSKAGESTSAASSSASYSPTPPQLPPVLPSPSVVAQNAASAAAAPQKSALQRLWDRYSIRGQQRRSLLAEAYFQAATRRASDPYVQTQRTAAKRGRRSWEGWMGSRLLRCVRVTHPPFLNECLRSFCVLRT
jgi:hypothetical protein